MTRRFYRTFCSRGQPPADRAIGTLSQRQEAGMSVMVDHERLEVESLGLRTVGQVLSHLQKDNRLVVNLLIDGREPDLDPLPQVRQSPVTGHTLFIETAEPREMALE